MDTETLKNKGLTEVQEIIARLGGWPVVQGEEWKGEENFKWYELVIKAAGETPSFLPPGFFIKIGKVVFTSYFEIQLIICISCHVTTGYFCLY